MFQMVDKSKETQNQVLVDLQTEIKSLKSLLLNRRVGPAGTGIPIAGNPGEAETILPQPSSSAPPAVAAPAPVPVPTSLQQKIPSVPSIPSWQLQAQEAKKEDGAAGSS